MSSSKVSAGGLGAGGLSANRLVPLKVELLIFELAVTPVHGHVLCPSKTRARGDTQHLARSGQQSGEHKGLQTAATYLRTA